MNLAQAEVNNNNKQSSHNIRCHRSDVNWVALPHGTALRGAHSLFHVKDAPGGSAVARIAGVATLALWGVSK